MTNDLDSQIELFSNRIKKREKHLRKWARRNGIECYRLYDRDIPEVPVVVDVYGDYLHLAEYDMPYKDLPGDPETYAQTMADAARRALGIPEDRVFAKTRRKTPRGEQYERFASSGVTSIVNEGGLRFEVNLSDYLDTGLFLDHRVTRAMVRDIVAEMAENRRVRVLNLFSYTASFTVYAASGGAAQTVSVDMSNTYSAWATRNLALNGMATDANRVVTENAFTFLESGLNAFDVIVLDPPTFSNSKKMERVLDVQRDHGELLRLCERRLAPNGIIVFSTNRRRFELTDPPPGFDVVEVSDQTIPEDFRNRRIHHAYLIERIAS